MSAHESVEAARRLRLAADRVEGAKRRAAAALEVARHHEREAAQARARADLLARTWGFCLRCGETECGGCDEDQ